MRSGFSTAQEATATVHEGGPSQGVFWSNQQGHVDTQSSPFINILLWDEPTIPKWL
jgi:hypothetical protein